MLKTMGPLALSALVLCAAGTAAAQELGESGPASLYGAPAQDIAALPTAADIKALWPPAAAARQAEGSAVASCTAVPAGALTGCQVMLERGSGFGAALVALAPKYRLKPVAEGTARTVVITAAWPVADTPADWRVQPKPGDFATTATDVIAHEHLSGRAVMNCLVGKLGTTYQCMVIYQNPPGKGFGTLLLRFAAYLKLKPALVAGRPISYGVNIPMNFGAPVANLIY
jgi:hypothetical protein|nr:hypothetical protein [Phenylobacterium sp.]